MYADVMAIGSSKKYARFTRVINKTYYFQTVISQNICITDHKNYTQFYSLIIKESVELYPNFISDRLEMLRNSLLMFRPYSFMLCSTKKNNVLECS